MKTNSEVEPAEINGSGKPVGGILPVTTAIFKITWVAITHAIPPTSNDAKRVFAFSEILTKQIISVKKIRITSVAPKNPSSSHIIENIKSLSANGRYKNFCRELKSPTPNSPPLPSE